MSVNRYYQDELTYLRELGALFAQANPKLAPFLAREAEDPDVERLLEAFAFLTGRLRQRVDDELPEIAVRLLQLIFPQYLRSIPPATILAFTQKEGEGGGLVEVPRNARVMSQPVQGTSCTFTTRYPVKVQPVQVDKVTVDYRANSTAFTIQFAISGKPIPKEMRTAPLRLHFPTEREPAVGRSLFLWFCRHLRSIRLEIDGRDPLAIDPAAVRPIGFDDEHGLIPVPEGGFSGFRILQEYLSLPSKFLSVEIDCFKDLPDAPFTSMLLRIETARPFPSEVRVQSHHVVANTTPAVNLFQTEAYPIAIDRRKSQYRVIPTETSQTIHSIDGIVGYLRGGNRQITFEPFESFRHDQAGTASPHCYFVVDPRPATLTDGIDHYVSFVDGETMRPGAPADSATVRITASNGAIAHFLSSGSVTRSSGSTPSAVAFRNITTVSAEVPPPFRDDLLWTLVSNLARNFGSIVDLDVLKSVIASLHFRARIDVSARQDMDNLLAGLHAIHVEPFDLFIDGRPVRSRRIVLRVREDIIGGEGEMFLFGSVMNAFFAALASVNSHHILRLEGVNTKVTYEWKPRRGEMKQL